MYLQTEGGRVTHLLSALYYRGPVILTSEQNLWGREIISHTRTAVPCEGLMTSSPGIPPPAVHLWHHQNQEIVCVSVVCVCLSSVNHVPHLSCTFVLFCNSSSHTFNLVKNKLSASLYSCSSDCHTHLFGVSGLKSEMVVACFLSKVLQTSQVSRLRQS